MNILQTLQAYDEISHYVQKYLELMGVPTYTDYKFEDGWLYLKINTSCSCHPEYEWEMECSYETFAELVQDEVVSGLWHG